MKTAVLFNAFYHLLGQPQNPDFLSFLVTMSQPIQPGVRIFVLATFFDSPNTDNAWSRAEFGESFLNAKCYGAVVSIQKEFARVKWELDGRITRLKISDIAGTEEKCSDSSASLSSRNIGT